MYVRLSVNVWKAVFAFFTGRSACESACVCDFGLEFADESFCELACESVCLSFLLVCLCVFVLRLLRVGLSERSMLVVFWRSVCLCVCMCVFYLSVNPLVESVCV